MRLPVGSVLVACMLLGCGDDRPPAGDGGGAIPDAPGTDTTTPPVDSGYDPAIGNAFTGPLLLDDRRVTAMDPTGLPRAATPCRDPIMARVRFVTDGDTVSVNGISEPLSEPVRLIGVDTPEVAHSGMSGECFGTEAAEFTGQLEDRIVWLTFDTECTDDFGRLLAYLWVGEGPQDLWERQLLRRGFGTVLSIAPNTSQVATFRADQSAAQTASVGLWSFCR